MIAEARRQFIVVCQGTAACRFRADDPLTFSYLLPDGERVSLMFTTRWMEEGLESRVPREVVAVLALHTDDLSVAAEEGARHANMTAAAIGLAMNAVVGTLEPVVVYDRNPIDGRREYHQTHVVPEQGMPRSARWVHSDLVLAVLAGLTASPHSERLHRAATHYNDALERWRPGSESLVVSRLWMAAEALTDVALRAELDTSGLDEQGLAASWGIDMTLDRRDWRRDLTVEVRRRLLFEGDNEVYSKAKRASDGWEHGFLPFDQVRNLAAEVRDRTAHYLRRAFLRLSTVEPSAVERLQAGPLDTPKQFFPAARYLKGWLVGEVGDPAAPSSAYPVMEWTYRLSRFRSNDDARTFTLSFEDNIKPHIADGVMFQGKKIEVWGPAPDKPDE